MPKGRIVLDQEEEFKQEKTIHNKKEMNPLDVSDQIESVANQSITSKLDETIPREQDSRIQQPSCDLQQGLQNTSSGRDYL